MVDLACMCLQQVGRRVNATTRCYPSAQATLSQLDKLCCNVLKDG